MCLFVGSTATFATAVAPVIAGVLCRVSSPVVPSMEKMLTVLSVLFGTYRYLLTGSMVLKNGPSPVATVAGDCAARVPSAAMVYWLTLLAPLFTTYRYLPVWSIST